MVPKRVGETSNKKMVGVAISYWTNEELANYLFRDLSISFFKH